ncbi:bifunctional 5,10-methylene-tetrahydrofolate dehydrogenase/5,10-methylene-tetrahydrofolate cyclohydrolase [Flavobacteriaceae bacterium]|jgi:methylenetetrahydrofolate dehydrogenase (NADP+)/methenyltetrahydrofolate cyclohydrolase|nr:bifunctional 5,10-methylene-tetrahydrofolate dehydrogenase/5,10-methylene-tetrahydrofolate cyclohydrolase [Flavobacteriaceae bacterium]MDB4063335.1 bifunctional 5,10-methylene-tetrahydrofolate dehydrogenase/5,10-methylene-tetrahydrofolate cyclohydrolase [Flavobacteriaceae bacterium]MDB4255367.1 bifunctional 5,10-methylene-tetrahydrofolate dehydrogenase/5,10-methylene-tetrahydrofolate cyclohydrolase [Flavobacteriaceae bacterium]MDC1392102.1 bifunctional 5,10-methylene-tetrahydrofolate dehydrog
MIVLDGKKTAIALKEEIKLTVDNRINDGKKIPHLAAVLVGNNGASLTYVGSKVRSCEQIGIKSTLIHLDETISENELLQKITQLNNDDSLDGYIVQLPLPEHINEEIILLAIDPRKDVDGFHPSNFGRMALEMNSFIPATPYGIMELLKRYKIETSGKHCVVIGRSHIVGRPISILMSQKGPYGNATVTVAHSRTENIKVLTRSADIIVSALGIPEFLKADMVKQDVVIIDVGITRVPDTSHPKGYLIKGDVAYEEVARKAYAITPVPGGVGPMTIAMLLKNTLLACERRD